MDLVVPTPPKAVERPNSSNILKQNNPNIFPNTANSTLPYQKPPTKEIVSPTQPKVVVKPNNKVITTPKSVDTKQVPPTNKQKDFLKSNNTFSPFDTANSTLQYQRPPTNAEVRAAMSATKDGIKNSPQFLAGTGYELANKQALEMITPALQKAGIDVTKVKNIYFKMGQEAGSKASTVVDVAMLYGGVGEAKLAVVGGIKLIKGANGALKVVDSAKTVETLAKPVIKDAVQASPKLAEIAPTLKSGIQAVPKVMDNLADTRKMVDDFMESGTKMNRNPLLGKQIQEQLLPKIENRDLSRHVEDLFRIDDKKPGGTVGEARRELQAAMNDKNITSPLQLKHYEKLENSINRINNMLKKENLNDFDLNLAITLKDSLTKTKNAIDKYFKNK